MPPVLDETGLTIFKIPETSLEISYQVFSDDLRIRVFSLVPSNSTNSGDGNHA